MHRGVILVVGLMLGYAPAWAGSASIKDIPAGGGHPRIIMAPQPEGDPSMVVVIHAGLRHEDGKTGVARVTQAALLEAPPSGTAWHEQLFVAGASLETGTNLSESCFYLTAPAAHFERLARDLLDKIYREPLDARMVVNGRRRAVQQPPAETFHDDVVQIIASTALTDPAFRHEPRPDDDLLESVHLQDVEEFRSRYFTPANSTVIIAGSAPAARMLKWLKLYRGGKRVPTAHARLSAPADYEAAHFLELHLYLFPVAMTSATTLATAQVAAAMLEERLLTTLRREGIAYAPSVFLQTSSWHDLIILVLPILPSEIARAMKLIEEELARMEQGDIPKEEMIRNRDFVMQQQKELAHNPTLLARQLASSLHLPGKWVVEQDRLLQQVAEEDIRAFLRSMVRTDRRVGVHFSRQALELELQVRRRGRGRY